VFPLKIDEPSRPGPRLKDAAIELYHFLNDDEAEEAPAA